MNVKAEIRDFEKLSKERNKIANSIRNMVIILFWKFCGNGNIE